MAIAKYGCSQNTFYAAAHVGVDRLIENIEDFSGVCFPNSPSLLPKASRRG
jgi:hypothetical protein